MCARDGDPFRLKEQRRGVINCRNGELWLTDDNQFELRPHRAESFLTYCLAVEYDPSAKCQLFDQTVSEIFAKSTNPADMVRHWIELMGYAIQPRRRITKAGGCCTGRATTQNEAD